MQVDNLRGELLEIMINCIDVHNVAAFIKLADDFRIDRLEGRDLRNIYPALTAIAHYCLSAIFCSATVALTIYVFIVYCTFRLLC